MSKESRPLWKIALERDEMEAVMNASVDRETGEIPDELFVKLDELEMEKDAKCLAVAAYIKSVRLEAAMLTAQGDVMRDEGKRYDARAQVHTNQGNRLEGYLARLTTPGVKLADATVAIKWRKSTAVEVTDEKSIPEAYLRTETTVTPDKPEIAKALKAGEEVAGCKLVEKQNMSVV